MTREDEDKLVVLWGDRVPVEEIARSLGYSVSYIKSYVSRHREKFPYRRRAISANVRELWMCRLLARRCTKMYVAKRLGVSHDTINRWLRMYESEESK